MGEAEIIPIEGRDRRPVKPQAQTDTVPRCRAVTKEGKPCKKDAVSEDGYCSVHAKSKGAGRSQHPSARSSNRTVAPSSGEHESLGLEEFLRRRLAGDYEVDDFGYDEQLSREVLLPLVRPLYETYFRTRTLGVDRIPHTGSALLICNHSGTIPLDAVMMQYAVATEHPARRLVRNVGADLVWKSPLIGPLARKSGNVVACDEDAYELIRRGELLGVFPEGYKGVGKGWSERYKLQRFGRGGYIELALRTKTPIVPVAIVGAEEAYPMIFNAKLLAKALGFPYFPITPTFPALGPLGLLPLRSRWVIEFGEPIPMDDHPEDAADDPMYVFDQSDRVRDTIQQMLYANLNKRGGAFF
jgi:1-acyl-sn-glycerol-3-phosphate acyltransferase